MKDITIKDVTKEELEFLYKKTTKGSTRIKKNKTNEIIKATILLMSITGISFLFLKILN